MLNPQKVEFDKLFKKGFNFRFRKVDYGSAEFTRDVELLEKKMNQSQRHGEVDLNDLRKFIINR